MWQYGSPGKGVVFDFRMGREDEGSKQFLGNFNGLLQTDGYKGYDNVGGPKMVHACRLAHGRRIYVGAVKANANDEESARIVAWDPLSLSLRRTTRNWLEMQQGACLIALWSWIECSEPTE